MISKDQELHEKVKWVRRLGEVMTFDVRVGATGGWTPGPEWPFWCMARELGWVWYDGLVQYRFIG